ncbi:class I adenylate-forming enzyme family protein [Streptomyces sp. NPDC127069]|uniref:class I adenylate-forming enzyme family protein n=1 Tax=Streptomyces sp. NPDC127069 TaxID=3347128 RepID=UPI00365CB940
MTSPLIDRFRDFGDTDALVVDGVRHTYAALAERVRDWQAYLDEHEVRAGQVVALEGACDADVCAAFVALAARGAIAVPLPRSTDARRAEYHETAEVEVAVVVDGAGGRVLERTGRTATHPFHGRLRVAGTAGLVLFSSGTTGRSKAIVLDLGKMLAQYGDPSRARRTLGFLSIDHIGGINTLLHTLNHGGTLVTVSDRRPDTVCAAIASYGVEVLPTTPTFLNMLLISHAHERHDLSSLRLVTYGTEPMPQRTLELLHQALPSVRLKQTYGLSELGIMSTKSKGDGSLWVKLGGAGFDYRIVEGILWIRSDTAMLGYLNASAPFDADGYFNTQDAVETDGDYVRILGRVTELINVAGEKVYPSEVESVLLEIPNIAEATVSGRPSHVTGMVVKATVKLVAPADPREVTRQVREYCGRRLEAYKVPLVVEVSDADQHSDRFKKVRTPA